MTDDYLRKLLNEMPPTEQVRWYQQQNSDCALLAGRSAKEKWNSRGVLSAASAEIPEAEEIVNETIVRIRCNYSNRYQWDDMIPGTFNKFFASCLKTTLNSLRSKARGHRVGSARVAEKIKILQTNSLRTIGKAG